MKDSSLAKVRIETRFATVLFDDVKNCAFEMSSNRQNWQSPESVIMHPFRIIDLFPKSWRYQFLSGQTEPRLVAFSFLKMA